MHFPRRPVWMNDPDMAKSMFKDIKGKTDVKIVEDCPTQSKIEQTFRTPSDREFGNVLFRRYPDGKLDYEWAKHIVLDALRKHRDGLQLTNLECCALTCMFPKQVKLMDEGMSDSMRRVHLKLTKDESSKIALLVAVHLLEEQDYRKQAKA